MKMDTYMSSFCKTLKADILRSKHRQVIEKAEKIVHRQGTNFHQLSRNTLIHFLYLESYCCHKTLLKTLMQQNVRTDTQSLCTIMRIMLRNLTKTFNLIKQYLQNRQVIIKFGHSNQKKVYSSVDQNASQVSEKAFTNFLEISTWLIKDTILLLNMKKDEASKSQIFESAMKFLHLVTLGIKRKKVRFRVNELEIKCLFVVFLFRMGEYSKGSKLIKVTLTEIYEFLFHLTHKRQKTAMEQAGRYKKAIKKCYKLLLVVLIYQAFFHVALESLHPVEALLSIIKQIQTITGPKELIKYYQGYKQITNQLLVAARVHQEFHEYFKNGQIVSLREILSIIEMRDNLKKGEAQQQDKKKQAGAFSSSLQQANCKPSYLAATKVNQNLKGSQRDALKTEKMTNRGEDKTTNFYPQFPQNSTQKILTGFGSYKGGIAFVEKFGNLSAKKSGHLNKFITQQIVRLSEADFQNNMRSKKNALASKKKQIMSVDEFCRFSTGENEKRNVKIGQRNVNNGKYATERNRWSEIYDNEQDMDQISMKKKEDQFVDPFARSTGSCSEYARVDDRSNCLKKKQLLLIGSIINATEKPVLDKFMVLLVKNKKNLSIWSLANKLEGHLKRQQNKKNKTAEQMSMFQDTLDRNNFLQKKQNIKFRSSSPDWRMKNKELVGKNSNSRLKINKMKSQNLQVKPSAQKSKLGGNLEEQEWMKQQRNFKLLEKAVEERVNMEESRNLGKRHGDSEIEQGKYEERLMVCYHMSQASIEDAKSKILKKSQNFRQTKEKGIRRSQAYFYF